MRSSRTGDFPKLLVNLNLDGRRVMDVIGDDWIINDGGETTIVVNDVTLHNGATGLSPTQWHSTGRGTSRCGRRASP